MKSGFKKAVVVSACLILLTGGVALAQGPGQRPPRGGMGGMHGMDRGGPGPIMGLLQELDLTEQQQDQLRATVHEHMGGRLGKLQEQSVQARRQLERLIHDPGAADEAIVEASHEVALNGEQLALERHKLTIDINQILTEEQREQLQEMLDKNPMRRRAQRFNSGG